MAQIVFYGKPGCQGNARQIQVLRTSGHEVVVRNLLAEPWTADRLLAFFGEQPVSDWFNRSAVRVKSGEIQPDRLAAEEALRLLVADPALIRRPLLEAAGERHSGWDTDLIGRWIGLDAGVDPGRDECFVAAATGFPASGVSSCPPPPAETDTPS